MNVATEIDQGTATDAGHFDVLIVGAGISGIDAAYHLQQHSPERSFALLETQDSFGGTWHTHKFPGIRSDSDLFTFGYEFKPWTGPPIATGEEILAYMGEVIDDHDLAKHIRYNHEVDKAVWSTEHKRWTLTVRRTDTDDELQFTCNFLYMCQGYYNHKVPYTPEWPGTGRFQGQIVHPQMWPDDLNYADKKVICIGSGATAATIIPR